MFTIVLVVYNSFVHFQIKRMNGTRILVVDNSIHEKYREYNINYCSLNKYMYVNMQGNVGLPKAYNAAISKIEKNMENWIIILDQDTELPPNFLEKYELAIRNNAEKKIFLPIIKDAEGIMSPTKKKGLGFSHSKLVDFNKNVDNYSFINSGMCINSTIFESVHYDENLFLDLVDHDFVETVRQVYGNGLFYIIQNLEIFQNFSGVTKNSLQSDLTRFEILIKDQTYFYKKNYDNILYSKWKLFLRALKLAIQHKNMAFFKLLGAK